MNDEKQDDDNPWDDDDGAGRTLATDGPSFELPSNIPSPISAPPPPLEIPQAPPAPAAAKHPAKATLVGLMPEAGPPRPGPAAPPPSSRMPLPRPPSARMPAVMPPARASVPDAPIAPPPVEISDDALDDLPGQQDDGPTMAVASPAVGQQRALRDDVLSPRPASHLGGFGAQASPMIDKDAETMAIGGDDPRLPRREVEETTRALSREEMMRHQDAHVIVGDDAVGDDATLALAPGQVDLGLGQMPGEPGLGPSLAEALRQGDLGPQPPHFPQPPPHGMYGGPGMQQPGWQGEGTPPSYRNPPQQGFDPMMQQQGQFPPSGQHPMAGPPQSNPMGWGPPPNAQTAYGPGMHPQGMMQPAPPWGAPAAPKAGLVIGGVAITSQIMLLVGVGVVCLAIFVIGIVLFVTTKF